MTSEDVIILPFRESDKVTDYTASQIIKRIIEESLQQYGSNPHMLNNCLLLKIWHSIFPLTEVNVRVFSLMYYIWRLINQGKSSFPANNISNHDECHD